MKKLSMMVAAFALAASACSGGDGGGVSIAGGGGGGDWCDRARVFDESLEVMDGDSPPSPAAMEAAYDDVSGQFDSITNGAPDEIKDDVATSVEGFTIIFEAFKDADFDFMQLDLAAVEALDDPKYETAGANVEAYLADTCGIVDEDSDGDEPTSGDAIPDDISGDDTSGDDDFELPSDGTMADVITQSLVQAGFTEGEAACLADALGSDMLAGADDPSIMLNAFGTCDIDLGRLAEMNG